MKQEDPNDAITVSISSVARFYVLAAFGMLVLFILSTLIYTASHDRFSVTLHGAEWSLTLLANLIVSYFSFLALKRTKERPWLYVACAAVIFACLALLRVLATVLHLRGAPAYWLYIAGMVGGIIGLLLYASGIVSLARQTKSIDGRTA